MRDFLWLGIAMAFYLPGTPQTAPGTAKIVIEVEDQSGAVVAGATVEVSPRPEDVPAELTTDSDGTARLVLPLGDYDLTVTKPGFAKFQKHIEIRDTAPQTVPVQIRVGTAGGPTVTEVEGARLQTESVLPNARTASFPEESEYPSPDKRYVIVEINNRREPYHTVFLRDNARGTQRKLFTYGRHISLLWNISGTTFAVTDYVGSNSSQVSVYAVDEGRAPVRALDLLFSELPEDARKALRAELTNHHVYLEASAWVAPTVLSVEVSGHGSANPGGFKRFYEAKLPESWPSQ